MNIGDLVGEEYKAIKSGIETDRKRYDQMLVLAITGLITIIGFSNKIPKEIIPYLISPFLMIATLVAALSRQHQFFKTAFIIEAYEVAEISKIKYERAYSGIFSSYKVSGISFKSIEKIWPLKCLLGEILDAIKRCGLFLFDPFILLAIFSSVASFISGRKYIVDAPMNDFLIYQSLYIFGLVFIHSIILFAVLRQKSLNIDYYRCECKKWIEESCPMSQIRIKKETTIQAYGEFWDAFLFLKMKQEDKGKGWSSFKLAALTMAAFSIEAFANHVGHHLFQSWKDIERGISPMGKLRMFIEMLKIEIKYEEAPFNTVHELMKWRNQVAHGTTETWSSSQIASPHNCEEILEQTEHSDWKKYVLTTDIERIDKDCMALMELIHKKAFGNLHWFLTSFRHSGTAE